MSATELPRQSDVALLRVIDEATILELYAHLANAVCGEPHWRERARKLLDRIDEEVDA